MTKHISPTALLCYLNQAIGLPNDLLSHVAYQLPTTWRQYYWILDLARVNKIPVLQRGNGVDGTTIRRLNDPDNVSTDYYCLVTWSNSGNVEFDWRYAVSYTGIPSESESDSLGWNFFAANPDRVWHQTRLLEEPVWRKRVSAIAQICGLAHRISTEVAVGNVLIEWNNQRYFTRCESICYRVYRSCPPAEYFVLRVCQDSVKGYTLASGSHYDSPTKIFESPEEFMAAALAVTSAVIN